MDLSGEVLLSIFYGIVLRRVDSKTSCFSCNCLFPPRDDPTVMLSSSPSTAFVIKTFLDFIFKHNSPHQTEIDIGRSSVFWEDILRCRASCLLHQRNWSQLRLTNMCNATLLTHVVTLMLSLKKK